MAYGNVRIGEPKDRKVYINGVYTALTPPTSPCTVTVEYGPNTFETLNDEKKIDFRGDAVIDEAHRYVVITLAAVDPPAPALLSTVSPQSPSAASATPQAGDAGEAPNKPNVP